MKNSIFLSLIILFSNTYNNCNAQNKLLLTDSLYDINDTIHLFVTEHRGNIQWEKSYNLNDWLEISGETHDTINYVIDTLVYLRARITEGSCNSIFTDTLYFKVFICGISNLYDFDGNLYNSVKIGNQCWMKENMKTKHYADGSQIDDGTNAGDISNDFNSKYWFYYNNDSTYMETNGLIYTWSAVVGGTSGSSSNPSGILGICPENWHVPSDDEWKELEMFLGMSQTEAENIGYRGVNEGGKLKEEGILHWNLPNQGATNESGFTALPSGYRDHHGNFYFINQYTTFWSSTEGYVNTGWYRRLSYASAQTYRDKVFLKSCGFSVRCVRDN